MRVLRSHRGYVSTLSIKGNSRPKQTPKDFLTPAVSAPYMRTSQYRKAHEQLERTFWWVLEPKEKDEVLSQTKEAVLRTITAEKNFWKIANDRYWCAKNAPDVSPDLINLITKSKVIGLEGYADLIIWERIESGDLKFFGHGWIVSDDIFSIAGRASWILREITGQHFGAVSMKSTSAQLQQLSDSWRTWYERNALKESADNNHWTRAAIACFA